MELGRKYLLAVLDRVPTREVALRARVTDSAVRKWRAGYATPSPDVRRALEVHLRIPASAWESGR